MSGSRLGRGRGGRLAVYGGCGVVVVLLVFLYRAATSEMARLRELHVQCAHQQEALAAQLQVIFEYKVRLEKSLAEEKSSNAAVKQELQQRASREKSLRDKDSLEAMQRFNSLQQTYKLLQTEHQDLQDECKKREKQALDDMSRLEATLQDLRSKIRMARDEKELSLNRLKTKYLELETEKTRLDDKYNEMLRANGNTNSTIDHLKKEVFQLKRELDEAKRSAHRSTSPGLSAANPQSSQQMEQPDLRSGQSAVGNRNVAAQPQQSTANPSTSRSTSAKSEASTKSNNVINPASTAFDKTVGQKPNAKLPAGVVPIPVLLDKQKDEEEDTNKREYLVQSPPKDNPQNNKENDRLAESNLDPGFGPGRHVGQILEGRNPPWLRVGVGVQEIGEPNQIGKMPEIDDGGGQMDGGDGIYDNDYEKDLQKNSNPRLEGIEDEGEDEEDQD